MHHLVSVGVHMADFRLIQGSVFGGLALDKRLGALDSAIGGSQIVTFIGQIEGVAPLAGFRPSQSDSGFRPPYDDPSYGEKIVEVQLDTKSDQGAWRPDVIAEQIEWLIGSIGPLKSLRIGDSACGPGTWARQLEQAGCQAYVGMDVNPMAIQHARRSAPWPEEFKFRRGDVLSDWNPAREDYDVMLFMYEMFNVFSDLEIQGVLARIWQALAPGGILVGDFRTLDGDLSSIRAGCQLESFPNGSALATGPHFVFDQFGLCAEPSVFGHRFWIIPLDARPTVVNSFVRLYSEPEIRSLLHESGFRVLSMSRPFDFRPTDAMESARNLYVLSEKVG